jgi:hypothetical protein
MESEDSLPHSQQHATGQYVYLISKHGVQPFLRNEQFLKYEEFPSIYETREFIVVFTRALSLS